MGASLAGSCGYLPEAVLDTADANLDANECVKVDEPIKDLPVFHQASHADQLEAELAQKSELLQTKFKASASMTNLYEETMQQTREHEKLLVEEAMATRHLSEKMDSLNEGLEATRTNMREEWTGDRHANRYGSDGRLTPFVEGRHVPVLALINPMSGAMAGADILGVARSSPHYQDRFFDIIAVVKSQKSRGGLLDVFREELCKAKDEAKKLNTRPRIISGGGDGTGSFTLFIIFLALKADKEREHDGLSDTGNGFIWTDAEMEESFPALAQMPLGSANDFGNILGWGHKYPGDGGLLCSGKEWSLRELKNWIEALCDPKSRVVNFDVFGILPPVGAEHCDFKLAELAGKRGITPKEGGHLALKKAGVPVPFLVCLYFSAGFGAYLVARFQINRRRTPLRNRAEYLRQGAAMIFESTPPEMCVNLDAVNIDTEGAAYFPPRRDVSKHHRGSGYREVGFYNIAWQAHAFHGYDRASATTRLNLRNKRKPATFDDGAMDLFRWKFTSLMKNPCLNIQTDKRKDFHLSFNGEGKGKGLFFQWDGEARFAFSPEGKQFNIFIRRVLNIPVVLGPFASKELLKDVDWDRQVKFAFTGDTPAEQDQSRRRMLQSISGELMNQLNASEEDMKEGGFTVGR